MVDGAWWSPAHAGIQGCSSCGIGGTRCPFVEGRLPGEPIVSALSVDGYNANASSVDIGPLDYRVRSGVSMITSGQRVLAPTPDGARTAVIRLGCTIRRAS